MGLGLWVNAGGRAPRPLQVTDWTFPAKTQFQAKGIDSGLDQSNVDLQIQQSLTLPNDRTLVKKDSAISRWTGSGEARPGLEPEWGQFGLGIGQVSRNGGLLESTPGS
jgi:hypothetical protein